MGAYKDFQKQFKALACENKNLISTTLSNIFSMRRIGSKTHGNLAEIGITEFVMQFMDNFECVRVADKTRTNKEEDIKITNKSTKEEFGVSLKAYKGGEKEGYLQLSTNKGATMIEHLDGLNNLKRLPITDKEVIKQIFESEAFAYFESVNVLALVYDENKKKCNVLVFDYAKARQDISKIILIPEGQAYKDGKIVSEKRRKHKIYLFLDSNDKYICEVRYGGKTENGLQRGFWTHIHNADSCYFDSLTNSWINYEHNAGLEELFKLAFTASEKGHNEANIALKQSIQELKK